MNDACHTPEAQLYRALARAQSEMAHAEKDKSNSHFRSTYASLPEVIDAVRPALNKHGIAVVQLLTTRPTDDGRGDVVVTTRLCHEGGGTLETVLIIPTEKPGAHAIGSAASYGRRYSLSALCGIADRDSDDDGNGTYASGPPRRQPNRSSTPRPAPKPRQPPPPAAAPASSLRSDVEAMVPGAFKSALTGMDVTADLFLRWCSAHQMGDPADWDGKRRSACLDWVQTGGGEEIRKWAGVA